jgi:DtxR family Mn-dependent transcriptional regulator
LPLKTEREHSHTAEENYLKAIFMIEESTGEPATTSAIAERLGVAPASVSWMLRRLAADGRVDHTPYRGVRLTDPGRDAALRIVRRHRLIETFLHEHLGIPWDEVHEEAEVLEHSVSDRVEARMAEVLGHPTRDPHGDPIPPRRGRHDERPDRPLAALAEGATARVARISDADPAALRHLARIGVRPGTELAVDERAPFGGPLWVKVGNRRHPLGSELVRAISVESGV